MFGSVFFGGLFDLNGDGKMSVAESALEFMFIDEMEKEDELESALCDVELDEIDLEFMDEEEREVFFEDAGLDVDDYDI